jgi:hypothetical protein
MRLEENPGWGSVDWLFFTCEALPWEPQSQRPAPAELGPA